MTPDKKKKKNIKSGKESFSLFYFFTSHISSCPAIRLLRPSSLDG
jgi:hypothetical protein